MANGFRFTGPACCCCNHIYTDVENSDLTQLNATSGNTPGKNGAFYGPIATLNYGFIDFDPVHKTIFAVRGQAGGDEMKVVKTDNLYDNLVELVTVGGSYNNLRYVTTDSDNARIFYMAFQNGTMDRDLWTINHDGTGNTMLGTLTNGATGNIRFPMHYCRANGKIYYCAGDAVGDEELYRIDADGTNDTQIVASSGANRRVFNCTVDNDNGVLWWIDRQFTGGAGQTCDIYKSDLDGAGATLVYSGPAIGGGTISLVTSVQWSHKRQKLYFWQYDALKSVSTDTANGLFSMDADGSNLNLDIARGNGTDWWSNGTNVNVTLRLGCGFENLGAGSTA